MSHILKLLNGKPSHKYSQKMETIPEKYDYVHVMTLNADMFKFSFHYKSMPHVVFVSTDFLARNAIKNGEYAHPVNAEFHKPKARFVHSGHRYYTFYKAGRQGGVSEKMMAKFVFATYKNITALHKSAGIEMPYPFTLNSKMQEPLKKSI